ncbi:DNA-processing protein DprA [Yaniella halotolerans]|uniref:DNA-processing protein DprA n=1 Tax=Yaniella halotolerans TaxID=225453 RepID=UPI0003B34C55|nr:DNA-processing protein DprA [Yaniella halotolerans]
MCEDRIRRARAGLTQIIEPADALGVVASKAWGPIELLDIIEGTTPSQRQWKALVGEYAQDGQFAKTLRNNLGRAIERWRRKSSYLKPEQALDYIHNLGGRLVIPEDAEWPAALADLESTEPIGLWTLGERTVPPVDNIVGLVGSREATSYGDQATRMLAQKARKMGLTVLSGGAYGIDAQAHHQALETPGQHVATIAVLAGGLDRLYPAGNIELLRKIARQGLLISEMPPGMRPNRYRFLNRNRLIAALARATIVVEARYRSGALNTANHAHDLNRTVGAVPGPINVPSSAGCHRLIKETPTLLVDDATDLGRMYEPLVAEEQTSNEHDHQRSFDMLSTEEMLVFEALPLKDRTNIQHLCEITGLAVPSITGILTKLSRHDLADYDEHGWRKAKNVVA